MKLTEKHYTAIRRGKDFHTLSVIQEVSETRNYVKFHLMETRWRSLQEAADYLRWASGQLEALETTP